jgi:hypothetical protein
MSEMDPSILEHLLEHARVIDPSGCFKGLDKVSR